MSDNRLWAIITDYENRAKRTRNAILKLHYLRMARELRLKLTVSD